MGHTARDTLRTLPGGVCHPGIHCNQNIGPLLSAIQWYRRLEGPQVSFSVFVCMSVINLLPPYMGMERGRIRHLWMDFCVLGVEKIVLKKGHLKYYYFKHKIVIIRKCNSVPSLIALYSSSSSSIISSDSELLHYPGSAYKI